MFGAGLCSTRMGEMGGDKVCGDVFKVDAVSFETAPVLENAEDDGHDANDLEHEEEDLISDEGGVGGVDANCLPSAVLQVGDTGSGVEEDEDSNESVPPFGRWGDLGPVTGHAGAPFAGEHGGDGGGGAQASGGCEVALELLRVVRKRHDGMRRGGRGDGGLTGQMGGVGSCRGRGRASGGRTSFVVEYENRRRGSTAWERDKQRVFAGLGWAVGKCMRRAYGVAGRAVRVGAVNYGV